MRVWKGRKSRRRADCARVGLVTRRTCTFSETTIQLPHTCVLTQGFAREDLGMGYRRSFRTNRHELLDIALAQVTGRLSSTDLGRCRENITDSLLSKLPLDETLATGIEIIGGVLCTFGHLEPKQVPQTFEVAAEVTRILPKAT